MTRCLGNAPWPPPPNKSPHTNPSACATLTGLGKWVAPRSEGVLTGAQSARVSADSRKGLLMDALYTGADEEFAFRRALSRLHEMQAARYQSLRERPNWLKIDSTPSETN